MRRWQVMLASTLILFACSSGLPQSQCSGTSLGGLTREQVVQKFGEPNFSCTALPGSDVCHDLYGQNDTLDPGNPGPCCDLVYANDSQSAPVKSETWETACHMQ